MEKHLTLQWEQNVIGETITNDSDNELIIAASEVEATDTSIKGLQVSFLGKLLMNGGGCLYINGHPIPLNSTVSMEITCPIKLAFTLKIPANSSVQVNSIEVCLTEEKESLVEKCSKDPDVLVVTPDYPSTHNLYLCAFVHSRVREYINLGLSVQVAAISNNWYEMNYDFDGVPVYSGDYYALKKLLSRKQYKVIVTHFVDVPLYQIYDGYISNEKLIFICHGPETTFRHLTNVCRQYFTPPIQHEDFGLEFDIKEKYVQKYARKENVEWIFVSEWFKQFSEDCCHCEFKNSRIIHNVIDEKYFPYSEKQPDDRKKIIILRKFDNISVHAIDESVLAILELSRRQIFNDLSIEVYGDGIYWEQLVEPLKQFKNVSLHRTFVPNDKTHLLYEKSGILLIPSRHDSQAVAMGEAVSCGVVAVGSSVTCVPDFMENDVTHVCAEPENYHQLADIIERLYNNPDEYLTISKYLSKRMRDRCSAENTVMKEIDLIKNDIQQFNSSISFRPINKEKPILTIVVPAYNVEPYLEKCLYSLCNHRNVGKTEIIVVNDGSKDKTLDIANSFSVNTSGVVRIIDKENGGHGSTINAGIKEANGKYFRLIDGDDWVDSENLAKLVDILEKQDCDLVLTKGCYEYVEKNRLENIIDYPMLREGVVYNFDDLLYPNYGFQTYGPLLTTGNYKTECLKKANFKIAEKKPYVDMEFNAYAQRYVSTVTFYDLDIYRYLIGRAGQTVSKDFWKKKYNDHRFIIFDILNTLDTFDDYPTWRREQYVYKHLLAMMIDSQVFMYDQLCLWNEIDPFFDELNKWPKVVEIGKQYIKEKNGDCKYILDSYKKAISLNKKTPLIGPKGERTLAQEKPRTGIKKMLKKAVKAIVPYGVVRIYQKAKH